MAAHLSQYLFWLVNNSALRTLDLNKERKEVVDDVILFDNQEELVLLTAGNTGALFADPVLDGVVAMAVLLPRRLSLRISVKLRFPRARSPAGLFWFSTSGLVFLLSIPADVAIGTEVLRGLTFILPPFLSSGPAALEAAEKHLLWLEPDTGIMPRLLGAP